jgi:DNA-binding SARP family transcriptional activator
MRKIAICLFILAGLVTAQAQDMDAMKHFNLALASSNTSEKIKCFTEALKLDPDLVDAYEKRGLLYYFQEKYDKVIQDFQRYIKLAPADSDGYRMLGMAFLKSEIYQPAIHNFTRTINIDPDIAFAYANRAEAYRLIGKYKEAIHDSTKAIEIWADPRTMSDAYRTRAKAYLAIGRKTEAFADNIRVTGLDPSFPSSWGQPQPIRFINAMALFVLNAIVFLFLFELRPNLLRIDKYSSLNILSSKLLAPQATDTVARERLYPLLIEIPQKKLTTIVAGAGYGKTTLIAQAGNYLNLNTVWYRLDTSDGDFIVFLSYLAAGIQKYFPGFGAQTCRWLAKKQDLKQGREAVLTIFLNELEKVVKKDLIIVLDDYHTIQYSPEIKLSLEFLLTHFPPEVHLILISRFEVDLSLSRLRAAREIVDIKVEDLAFTPDETDQLYSQLFYISLKQESLEILQQKTEGWVSGLILFYHALRGKKTSEIESLLLKLKGSHKLIFSYLEENVYNSLTDKKKEFLLKTSILPRVNAEFCDRLMNINYSRDILKDLEENHLFTSSLDEEDEWYTYHQLFRDFLQAKLITELGCQASLELYKHAAELLGDFSVNEAVLGYDLNTEALPEVGCLLSKNEQALWDSLKLLPKPNNLMTKDAPPNYMKIIPKAQVPALKVYFFGKFRVLKEVREIPDNRWKSKKAQMLFKYMLYTRHKGYLKKDVFMELLWPEEDPVKTAKRFHVALASLKKTLEPEKERGIPSAYIARSGDAYRIDIGNEGSLDIEDFREELKLARDEQNPEMAFQHYLKAATIYQGDFLEEDLYVSWCDEERERIKEDYIYILTKIITYYENQKDYSACIDYIGRYIKVDKYAENIYQQLMRYYALIGNKAMVVRTFERCNESITKELDIPLSRETEALFQKLLSS